MNNPYVAIHRETKEVVGIGNSIAECWADADSCLGFKSKPGEVAPYFVTNRNSVEFWGGWFREGFWKTHKKFAE